MARASVVQGYEFTGGDDDPDTGNICQILGRADVSDLQLREMGCAFRVKFGDGHTRIVYGDELTPWYPV